MGFVGFHTSEDAQKAKDWFDGTWLQSSRIKVDFAKEVGLEGLAVRQCQ